jgi:hypothetical protein
MTELWSIYQSETGERLTTAGFYSKESCELVIERAKEQAHSGERPELLPNVDFAVARLVEYSCES